MTEEHSHRIPRRIEVSFIAVVVLFFLVLAGFAWVVNDIRNLSEESKQIALKNEELLEAGERRQRTITRLVAENQNRIQDIQKSRIESCIKTYSGIREVFTPFFPPKPRTKQQQDDLDKFNTTIDGLQQGCVKQTDPDKGE